MMKLTICKLRDSAKTPSYAHDDDACFDLHAAEPTVLPANAAAIVPTGLAFAVPDGYALDIRGRSGMAFGLNVAAWHGTVDAGYRGEVRVLLRNYSDNNITIKAGDRIAQARLTPSPRVTFEVAEQLDMTERGIGGFGSSGV